MSTPSQNQNSTRPLVSVILLTYNRPHFLRYALSSALQQTYENMEILICNNASEQSTTDVVESFKDPRIIHRRHDSNMGMTANVQDGFQNSNGKYLTNLHDDDFWAPSFIERMVEALESNPEAVLAFCDHSIVDAQGNVNVAATEKNSSFYARSRLKGGLYQPFKEIALVDLAVPIAMATVFRKSAIDWSDFANVPSVYDYWLSYIASRDGAACYYVKEKLTFYRHHEDSESTKERVRVNDGYIAVYERMLKDPRMEELYQYFIPRYADHHRDAAVSLLRNGMRENSRQYLKKGMNIHFTIRAFLTYAASYLPHVLTKHLPLGMRFN